MSKKYQQLSFEDACKFEGEVWVKNRTDKRGRGKAAPIHMTMTHFLSNKDIRFTIPVKFPIPLSSQIDKETMKNDSDFRRRVHSGEIELYENTGFTEEDEENARRALKSINDRFNMVIEPDRPSPISADVTEANLIGNIDIAKEIQQKEDTEIDNALKLGVNDVQPKVIDAVAGFTAGIRTTNQVISQLDQCVLYQADVNYLKTHMGGVPAIMEYVDKELELDNSNA